MPPACFVGSGASIVATMNKDLKITLESLVARYNTTAFMENDPVLFPRCFLGKTKQDIEIAAFLASTIAWGNRKQIMNGCRKMLFDIMDGKPYNFVMHGSWQHIDPNATFTAHFLVVIWRICARGCIPYSLKVIRLNMCSSKAVAMFGKVLKHCVKCLQKPMAVNTQSTFPTRHPTDTRAVRLANA